MAAKAASGRRDGAGGVHWEERNSCHLGRDDRVGTLWRRLRKKRRSRFPVGSGTLLDPSREFPGWIPKLWLIAVLRDAFHVLG